MKRIVVGAHYGTKDWILQRLTAVFMAIYTVVFLLRLLSLRLHGDIDYVAWQKFFLPGWFRLLTFLFFVNLSYHAWIGMRDIWMDYVKNTKLRLALQYFTILILLGYAFWATQILWR